MSYLSVNSIKKLGFKRVGKGVKISKKASIYNAKNISVGDWTRIDDFVVLSAGKGGIEIGRNVHMAVYSSLIGQGKIVIDDFANISSRVAIYSSNDDYSGKFMSNPTVDKEFTNVTFGDVYIGRHVIIGFGSGVLPNVKIREGAVVGALSLVKKDCKSFCVYGGVPAKLLKKRSRRFLKLEKELVGNRKKTKERSA